MFIIVRIADNTYRLNQLTGETWLDSFGTWVPMKEQK